MGVKMADLAGKIIEYESDEMSDENAVKLFSELVKSGMVWTLQGHYGRTAKALMDSGVLDENGKINYERLAEAIEG